MTEWGVTFLRKMKIFQNNFSKEENPKDFLLLLQRGLGAGPESLGGKGGFQGGKERTKRFLFPPWWNKNDNILDIRW